jgi:hypothetical protein
VNNSLNGPHRETELTEKITELKQNLEQKYQELQTERETTQQALQHERQKQELITKYQSLIQK